MERLDAIFAPKSVAVVGASATPGKVGHDIFVNILRGGYTGTLFPVNPKARSIAAVKAFPSLTELPDPVDLAMIILPPRMALAACEEAAKIGVKGLVIVSAGFREVGAEGREIEDRIVSIANEAGMRVVGPNCLGVINPHAGVRLNASFSARMPAYGNISFISQSGALCTAVLDFAADREFGFSKFISIGNKADVDELDLLRYLHLDAETGVIMLYIEELRRPGEELISEIKNITSGDRPTPILAIKSGRTSAGAAAAASHTGSLAGAEGAYDALFTQAGIIRVDTIEDMFDFANAFTFKRLPAGNKVAIVTNAGGPGIVATDMTVSSGLELAHFQDETVEALRSHLPPTANLHNPVDVIGDASHERYENALRAVINDENVHGALVILTPQSMTDVFGTAEAIQRIYQTTTKPILCCFMGVIDVSSGVDFLQEHGVPVYRFPEEAARAFGATYTFSRWLHRQKLAQFELSHDRARAAALLEGYLAEGRTRLAELDGLPILEAYGFHVLPTQLARSREEAQDTAEAMGFPVVLKVVSPQIVHKTDVGGVVVGPKNRDEVGEGWDQIHRMAAERAPDAEITGVLVQKLAGHGEEIVLGASRHPTFGPLVMFGLGGIFVEVFKDVVFRIAPVWRNTARRMIQSIHGHSLLLGVRGRPPVNIEALERAVVNLSCLVSNHPEIKELDINPLLAHPDGCTVADCRIMIEPPPKDR